MTINLLSLLAVPKQLSTHSATPSLRPGDVLSEDPRVLSFADLLAPTLAIKSSITPTPTKESADRSPHPPLERNEQASPHVEPLPLPTNLILAVGQMAPPPAAGSIVNTLESRAQPYEREKTPNAQSSLKKIPPVTLPAEPALEQRATLLNVSPPPDTMQNASPPTLVLTRTPLRELHACAAQSSSVLMPSPPALPDLPVKQASAQELHAPLGSPQWQRDLSQQIIFHRHGTQTLHLKLHPEELGDLKISMTVNKDHAELMMVSNHGQVRAALEAALPQLRQALADNGIQLGNSQVGQETTGHSFHGSSHPSSSSHPQPSNLRTMDHPEPASNSPQPSVRPRDGSQISLLV